MTAGATIREAAEAVVHLPQAPLRAEAEVPTNQPGFGPPQVFAFCPPLGPNTQQRRPNIRGSRFGRPCGSPRVVLLFENSVHCE